MRRTICLLLCLALLNLSPLLPIGAQAASAEDAARVTLRFFDPFDTNCREVAPGESLTLESGPEIEGYTFLGWQDENGQYELRESLRIYEDTDYYAVYALALRDEAHTPYLRLDEAGFCRPWDGVTRREVAVLLYELLDTELVGEGRFLDVPEDDACYRAVATLKTLGVLSGSRFHPDEEITRVELLELLSPFFPPAHSAPDFADLAPEQPAARLFAQAVEQGWLEGDEARPDEVLQRAEFAQIINRVLGRTGDSEARYELVGTLLDMPHSDPAFWDMAEAVIPHHFQTDEDGEHWTKSEALPMREAGLFFLGERLHAIDENGDPVSNAEYQGLPFNARGEVTSGSEELDELIWAAMEGLVDPQTMSQEEMLKEMFQYAAHHFRYVGRHTYEFGETGWEQDEALQMLRTGKGNCYSFAAIFYYFARALGYDPVIYSGSVNGGLGDKRPHGWVEIEIDDEMCIFDPELQFLYDQENAGISFYRRGGSFHRQFGYKHA